MSINRSLSFCANNTGLPHFGTQQQLPTVINVVLTYMGETMLIKNVGVENQVNDSGMYQICLAPILNHIQNMGKKIVNMSISYYSDKDQMEVFVGKHPIDPNYSIPMDDFTDKLKLKITQ